MSGRVSLPQKKCENCGNIFYPKSGAQKHCAECRKVIRKQQQRESKARTKVANNDLTCCICGGRFGEMIHGKPYCWKHRSRYWKYGSFELPVVAQKASTSKFEIRGDVLEITTESGDVILADAEDLELLAQYSWRISSHGYVVANKDGEEIYMHRLVMGKSSSDDCEIDHISGRLTDNRKRKLRVCSHRENLRNLGIQKGNKSGCPGVRDNGFGRFKVFITVDYKQIYIGTYSTFEEAVAARKAAEDKYHGKFAGHLRRESNVNE